MLIELKFQSSAYPAVPHIYTIKLFFYFYKKAKQPYVCYENNVKQWPKCTKPLLSKKIENKLVL